MSGSIVRLSPHDEVYKIEPALGKRWILKFPLLWWEKV